MSPIGDISPYEAWLRAIGALAVISAGVLAWQRLRRSMDRRFADIPERIIVNYQTRDQ
jgi:hypothetical protein